MQFYFVTEFHEAFMRISLPSFVTRITDEIPSDDKIFELSTWLKPQKAFQFSALLWWRTGSPLRKSPFHKLMRLKVIKNDLRFLGYSSYFVTWKKLEAQSEVQL